MSVHIELDGFYRSCVDSSCPLPIHLPLNTVEEARALPYPALLALMEAFDPPFEIYPDGEKAWRDEEGRLHRDYDLPAVTVPAGTMEWRRHGARHRDYDLPAIIYDNGDLHWYLNGVRHRADDKPAIVKQDGACRFFIEGIMYFPNPKEAY